jgi:hypothetical protein
VRPAREPGAGGRGAGRRPASASAWATVSARPSGRRGRGRCRDAPARPADNRAREQVCQCEEGQGLLVAGAAASVTRAPLRAGSRHRRPTGGESSSPAGGVPRSQRLRGAPAMASALTARAAPARVRPAPDETAQQDARRPVRDRCLQSASGRERASAGPRRGQPRRAPA